MSLASLRPTNIRQSAPSYEGSIIVDQGGGGDYTTIKEALNAATARTCIVVYPGIYQEDNPLPGVANVTVKSCGEQNTTRIEALNANQDLFTSENFFIIDGFSLANVSGTGWVMDIAAAHAVIISECVVFQCEQGFRTSHISAVLTLRNVFYLAIGGTKTDPCLCNNAGSVTQSGGRVGVGSTVGTIFDLDGAAAITNVINFLSSESTVDYAIEGKNGAQTSIVGGLFALMNDGFVLSGGARFVVFSTIVANAAVDNIRIDNVGADTQLSAQGILLSGAGQFDVNVLSATAVITGFGFLAPDQVNFVSGAQLIGATASNKEDDEGIDVYGELHVGTPEVGSESVFGGGDSYTRGMLVYTYNPAGAVWTDVSTEARSASGSTFTFPAIAQNNAIYAASSLQNGGDFLQHPGIKASITTAVVLGGGSIVVEYWNGGAWVAIEHMSALANAPYTQYAEDIFERTGSEQIRYPQAFLSLQAKNDPMTLGTTYYWIRFRIATAVTTVPIFEQFKLHTDRFEVNADGISEYFGAARYPKDLGVHQAMNYPVTGSAPGNAAIAFSASTTLTLNRNQFSDNQVHSFGSVLTIPDGLDTSIPLTLEIGWYADTANAGNVELTNNFAQLEIGDLWDGSKAESASTPVVAVVGAGTRWVSRLSTFDLDVSLLVPGELLVFRVQRDATGPNDPPDTLSGNIIIGTVRMFGYFWRP